MTTPRTRNERLREIDGAMAWPDRRQPAAMHSRIQRFISVVAATRGEAYVTSWLSDRTCDFSQSAILTTSTGVDRLRQDFGRLAGSLGVRPPIVKYKVAIRATTKARRNGSLTLLFARVL